MAHIIARDGVEGRSSKKFCFKYVVGKDERSVEFQVDARCSVETIGPKQLGSALLNEELDKKLEKLRKFVSAGNVLFILNDGHRSTPTARILEALSDYITEERMDFIIATGSHKPPTVEEMRRILGKFYDELKERVVVHKAKECKTAHIGKTSRGTEVHIDAAIFGHDKIVNINSVAPHYFAGYTGGRKSFLPGLCSYTTIEQNHSNAMHPNSKAISLDTNPVHQDMLEGASMIVESLKKECNTEFLTLNILVASNKIFNVNVGKPFQAMEPLIKETNSIFCSEIDCQPDIIIAITTSPGNKNLYQALKAFENTRRVLREGGIIILVAACTGGIGPVEFYELLASSDDPGEIIESVKVSYRLGAHKSTNLLAYKAGGNHLYVVSDLEDGILKKAFMTPFATVQAALDEALKIKEEEEIAPNILIIKDAANTTPLLR